MSHHTIDAVDVGMSDPAPTVLVNRKRERDMSSHQTTPASPTGHRSSRARLTAALPWLWLALSAFWAVIIVTTDQLAWPLALWIATTLGPLTVLRSRVSRRTRIRRGFHPRADDGNRTRVLSLGSSRSVRAPVWLSRCNGRRTAWLSLGVRQSCDCGETSS